MSEKLKPWAIPPFELLVHGEVHRRSREDYDRRIAYVSFDSAIDSTITTYLKLHSSQRGGKEYKREDVAKWLKNFHQKVRFFYKELEDRGQPKAVEQDVITWYHDQRNDYYHGGRGGTPTADDIEQFGKAAQWVFHVLFGVNDLENMVAKSIREEDSPLTTVPPGFSPPSTSGVADMDTVLAVFSLVGGFDENNKNDTAIIERIAREI